MSLHSYIVTLIGWVKTSHSWWRVWGRRWPWPRQNPQKGVTSLHLKDQDPQTSWHLKCCIFNRIFMTRFQLILPVADHNATKTLRAHRMHVAGPQIYQINRQKNSLQNMYGMLKATIDWLAKKIDFVQKTPQNRLFWCARIWVTWLWKDLDAKPLTPTSGVALKTLGCNASN